MIQPLAGQPGPLPRPDRDPPARPGGEPSPGFAQLLGSDARIQGPQLEERHGAGTQPPERPAAPLLQSPEEEAAQRAASAERFNEHGFFGRPTAPVAAPIDGPDEPARAIPSPEAVPPAGLPADPGLDAGRASEPSVVASRAGGAVPRAASGRCDRVAPAGEHPASLPGSGAPSLQGAETGPDVADPAPEVTASPARRLLVTAGSRGAQSAVSVALREAEHGVQVAALAGALSADDRRRLQDEIAALLSRHGLVPRRIHIAARHLPPAQS